MMARRLGRYTAGLVGLLLGAHPAVLAAGQHCAIHGKSGNDVVVALEGTAWEGWNTWCPSLNNYINVPAPPVAQERAKELADDVQKALQVLGFFAKVSCATSQIGTMNCTAHPNHIVKDFDIGGTIPFALLKEDLRRRMFLRPGTLVPEIDEALARQQQRLREYLEQEGYFASQVDVHAELTSGAEPGQGLSIKVVSHPGDTLDLRHVNIEGDHVVDDADVARIFHHAWVLWVTQVRFRPAQFNDDLLQATQLLQDRGYPAARVQGKFQADPSAGVVDITLQIRSGPRLVLEFTGNNALSNADLDKEATFRTAGAVDAVEIETVRSNIVQAYQRKGYYAVDVTATARKDDSNALHVLYTVQEGPRGEVSRVTFIGNTTFDATTLQTKAELITQPSRFLARRWVDAWVEHDRRAIGNHYQNNGFPDARVQAERRVLDPEHLEVIFTIEEGVGRKVQRVDLAGYPIAADPNGALEHLALKQGAPYVPGKLESDAQELHAQLASHGFMNATIDSKAETMPNSADMRVVFDINAGQAQKLGGLIVRGNFRTKPSVIAQELGLNIDAPLNVTALGAARRRLRAFNIFNSLQLTPLATVPPSTQTWVLVGVEELDVRNLDAVLAFSTDVLLSVGADYRDRNVFGRAIGLDITVRLSNASEVVAPTMRIGNMDKFEAKLRAPHPFGLPFDAEGTGFYDYQDLELYRYRRVGGTGALIRTLLPRGACEGCPSIVGRLGYELTQAYVLDKTIGDLLNGPLARQRLARLSIPSDTIARLVPAILIDARDAPMDPHSGYALDLRFEIGHPYLAGPFYAEAAQFWRFISGLQGYYTLGTPVAVRLDEAHHAGGPVIAAASFQYSAAGPWGAKGRVPRSETFAYGGDFSVRGLLLRASALAIADAHYMTVSVFELRWYVLQNFGFGSVQLAGFADVGTIARRPAALFGDTTVSVGPVLRYVTPVGPLSLAYGWPIVRPASLANAPGNVIPARGRFHLSFGYSF